MHSSASTTTLTVDPQRYFVALYGIACITVVLTLLSANVAIGLTAAVGVLLAFFAWRAAMDPTGSSTIRIVYSTSDPQVRAWIAGRWYRDVLARVESSCRWFVRLSLRIPDGRWVPVLVFWPASSSENLRALHIWAKSLRPQA
ncbi:MAG: hypothetical protein AB8G16_09180 [Gammaproteobacteria bacterium]